MLMLTNGAVRTYWAAVNSAAFKLLLTYIVYLRLSCTQLFASVYVILQTMKESMDVENCLINIENCRIQNQQKTLIPNFSWQMKKGQAWLVIGANGGGKADFLKMLAGQEQLIANSQDSEKDIKAGSF